MQGLELSLGTIATLWGFWFLWRTHPLFLDPDGFGFTEISSLGVGSIMLLVGLFGLVALLWRVDLRRLALLWHCAMWPSLGIFFLHTYTARIAGPISFLFALHAVGAFWSLRYQERAG